MTCLPIINNDLSWQVGRGIQIYLGIDPICSMECDYKFSRELVLELHCKNIFVLKQIHLGVENNRWAHSSIMALTGFLAEE